MKKLHILILTILFLIGVGIKFHHFHDPYFGPHLSRQLQTMSTITAYVHEGVDLLRPRTNYVGWPGYMIYEFPVFQAVSAWVTPLTGDPLTAARGLNILMGTLSAGLVFWLARRWFDARVAVYSMFFFAFTPLHIDFHRSTMVDIASVFFALLAVVFCWWAWDNKKPRDYLLFTLSGLLCILIKPLYFIVPGIFLAGRILSAGFTPSAVIRQSRQHRALIGCMILVASGLAAWLIYSAGAATNSGDTLAHLGWSKLLHPKLYVNIFVRSLRQYFNPLNILFFVIGVLVVWQGYRRQEQGQLLWVPLLYYGLFPNINFPHAYYALILMPYVSVVSGCGAAWLEEKIIQEHLLRSRHLLRSLLITLAAAVSMLMFVLNTAATHVLPGERYSHAAREVAPHLTPMSYGAIYINKEGAIRDWEHLRNRPSLYLASFFRNVPEGQLKINYADTPIVSSAMLYALNLYGQMRYITPTDDVSLPALQKEFANELRYVLFYLFDDQGSILDHMHPYRPIYTSEEWMVFDVQQP